jgi:hypothetical protein
VVSKSPKKHYVLEWGINGVKKYTSKQHAVKFTCELLQGGEPSVKVYSFFDYEADLWSYDNRSVERFVKIVMPYERTPYLIGMKADLFS